MTAGARTLPPSAYPRYDNRMKLIMAVRLSRHIQNVKRSFPTNGLLLSCRFTTAIDYQRVWPVSSGHCHLTRIQSLIKATVQQFTRKHTKLIEIRGS